MTLQGTPGGEGKEVTHRRLCSATGLMAEISTGAVKNKGGGAQLILSRGQERARRALEPRTER